MNWKWCNIRGKVDKDNPKVQTNYQLDTVGNIYQKTGAVKAVACQKCKIKFSSEKKVVPITHARSLYSCVSCKFKNTSAEAALDHKLETDHKIKKDSKQVVTNVENQIVGIRPNIIKTKTDVKILCNDCV